MTPYEAYMTIIKEAGAIPTPGVKQLFRTAMSGGEEGRAARNILKFRAKRVGGKVMETVKDNANPVDLAGKAIGGVKAVNEAAKNTVGAINTGAKLVNDVVGEVGQLKNTLNEGRQALGLTPKTPEPWHANPNVRTGLIAGGAAVAGAGGYAALRGMTQPQQ